MQKTLPVNDNEDLCVLSSVELALPGLPRVMTLLYCIRRTWFEMKEQMKISDMGFTPNTNMLKSKKWRGQPVFGEQSEKFVICGRKREGH